MKARVTLLTLALGCFLAVDARAEPFTVLPNGNVVFNVSFTTSGTFVCLHGSACQASGNSVTLGSGDSTSTIVFNGATGNVAIGNTSTFVPLGEFQSTATDPDFTFPTILNPQLGILAFVFNVTMTSPQASSHDKRWVFGPGGTDLLHLRMGPGSTDFPAGPNPPGANYEFIDFTFAPFPFSLPANGRQSIGADVGAVPEPATILLLGSGLLAALARRRRELA